MWSMGDLMSGEARFREALKRVMPRPSGGDMPKPDDQWGVWVEYRLQRLEDSQKWMLRVILAALLAQFALEVIGML
jgi:hypothetical protein